ncbi:hypothetical protein [Xanthobacter sp. ZOL 2024]
MLQITDDLGGCAVMLLDRGAAQGGTWGREVGREEAGGENWQPLGALAGAAIDRLRIKRMELKALTAFVEGRVYADAYRQLVMLVLAREPHLKGTIQEIEQDALARVAALSSMPIEGAGEIENIMETVRSNVAATWNVSVRTVAPRTEAVAPGGVTNVAPVRRRGRPSLAAE